LSKPETVPTNNKNNTSMNSGGAMPNYQSNNLSNYVSNNNVVSSRGVKCVDISVDPSAARRGSDGVGNYSSNHRKTKPTTSPPPAKLKNDEPNPSASSVMAHHQQVDAHRYVIGDNEKTIKPYLNNFVEEPKDASPNSKLSLSNIKQPPRSVAISRNASPRKKDSSVEVIQYDIFREKVMKRNKSSARLHDNYKGDSNGRSGGPSARYVLDNSLRNDEKSQYNSRYSKVNDVSINNTSNLMVNNMNNNSEMDDMRPESLKIFMALKDSDKNYALYDEKEDSPKKHKP